MRILYGLLLSCSLAMPAAVLAQSAQSVQPTAQPATAGTSSNRKSSAGQTPPAQNIPDGGAFSSGGFGNPGPPPQNQEQPQRKHMLLHKLGDGVEDIGHATCALIGATIGQQDIDLPPDTDDNLSWPFRNVNRKAMYNVVWTNGNTGAICKMPDGSFRVSGNGKQLTMQPEPGGAFAILGEDGTMATLTPRLDGGYTMMNADGTTQTWVPREGGGYTVMGSRGPLATIIPGPNGTKHIFGGKGNYTLVH